MEDQKDAAVRYIQKQLISKIQRYNASFLAKTEKLNQRMIIALLTSKINMNIS